MIRETGQKAPQYMLHHHRANPAPTQRSSIEGLWVLLVDGEAMMAQAGNDQMYLLGFTNAFKARKFVASQDVVAEPRMIVRANKDGILASARASSAIGVLVDYDLANQSYVSTIDL
jgi:hypothetical protein